MREPYPSVLRDIDAKYRGAGDVQGFLDEVRRAGVTLFELWCFTGSEAM